MRISTYRKMVELADLTHRSTENQIAVLMKEEKRLKASFLKGYKKHNKITQAFVDLQIEKIDKAISKYEWMLKKNTEDEISEERIQQARDFPITNLIEFNQAGKSMAWCHEDKSPSLSFWRAKNKCRCFVCNLTFDTIAVLMERDGYSFVDAIKKLT